jgi:hypothetical protein
MPSSVRSVDFPQPIYGVTTTTAAALAIPTETLNCPPVEIVANWDWTVWVPLTLRVVWKAWVNTAATMAGTTRSSSFSI